MPLPNARRWSLDDPFLHEVTVSVGASGRAEDRVQSSAAVRNGRIAWDERREHREACPRGGVGARHAGAKLRPSLVGDTMGPFTGYSVDDAGLAWGDRSKPLPAGEYWAECRIDGIEFESNRLRLLRSTSAAGDLALGDGRTANVTGVEIGFEGMALARLALPADTALRIEMPRPRRPDAPIAIVFHIEQVTGQPLEALPAAIVRRMTCVGEFMAREPPTVEPFRPGVWQVTRILAPVGSRWRPGEYEAGCQVFQVVLAIR